MKSLKVNSKLIGGFIFFRPWVKINSYVFQLKAALRHPFDFDLKFLEFMLPM